MKKKTMRGSNHEGIKKFLTEAGPRVAADIQKALGIKGNVYTMLAAMVKKGLLSKRGKMYFAKRELGATLNNVAPVRETQPNPYVNMLKREHEHLMQGIQQLQITANYINLRIKELERASQA